MVQYQSGIRLWPHRSILAFFLSLPVSTSPNTALCIGEGAQSHGKNRLPSAEGGIIPVVIGCELGAFLTIDGKSCRFREEEGRNSSVGIVRRKPCQLGVGASLAAPHCSTNQCDVVPMRLSQESDFKPATRTENRQLLLAQSSAVSSAFTTGWCIGLEYFSWTSIDLLTIERLLSREAARDRMWSRSGCQQPV